MTSRGQKKPNDTATEVARMLTNPKDQQSTVTSTQPTNSNNPTNAETSTQLTTNTISPANTKDNGPTNSPAMAKDIQTESDKIPACAKDDGGGGKGGADPAKAKDTTPVDAQNDPITKTYLQTLGSSAPKMTKDHEKDDAEEEIRQLIADKQVILNKAMKAVTEGDAEAYFLFRMHSRMIIPMPIKKDTTDKIVKKVIEIRDEEDKTSNLTKLDSVMIDEDE